MPESNSSNGASPIFELPKVLNGKGVALAVIFGWLVVYIFEGARLGLYGVPFTDVTVSGATVIRCLASITALFFLLGWSLIPGFLLLWQVGARVPLRHAMTAILGLLFVLAFTGVMVRFFAYVFVASTGVLVIVYAVNAARRRWGSHPHQESESRRVASSEDALVEDRLEEAFAMLGVGLRAAAIVLLAAFVAGRDAALHQESFLVRHGTGTTVTACLADQGDKLVCIISPGSPKPKLSFLSKTAPHAQGLTVERVGFFVRPFGIWDTPRGRGAWSWARQELQQE